MNYLIVLVGGGLGSVLRYGVNVGVTRAIGGQFPWGIAFINVTGSTLMGLVAGYFALRGDASQSWRLFLTTGILGGYTTFSAFSLDAAVLYQRGAVGEALAYVVGSVVLSIAGLFAGLAIMRAMS